MKTLCSPDDLALFGARPTFDSVLHVGRPNLVDRDRFLQRLDDILERRWFTNDGHYVRRLEESVADWLEVGHCIAVSNATAGLELVVRSLGLTGEVIVPAMTFVATAHAASWAGLRPVFCDVDASHNLDVAKVRDAITSETSAILAVHLWGRPCAPRDLEDVATSAGVELVFDAAHALGCSCGGAWIGSFGRAEVFSLHATKFVNSFEGGLITTNDDGLARELRLRRNFGFTGVDEVSALGINAKMSEPSAAMGLTQLEGRDRIIATNQRNFEKYRERLDDIPGISLLEYPRSESCNFQYVVVEVEEERFGLCRELLLEILHAENVHARRYFYPGVHRMEPYASSGREWNLPVTESICSRVLILPTGDSLGTEEIDQLCDVLGLAHACAEAVLAYTRASRRGRA